MKLSIKKQMFLVIVIFLFTATILLGSFMYVFFSNKLTEFMLSEFDYNNKQKVIELDNIVKRIQNFNDYLSLDSNVATLLKTDTDDVVKQVYTINTLSETYGQLFNVYFGDYSYSLKAYLFVDEGQPVSRLIQGDGSFSQFGGEEVQGVRRSNGTLYELLTRHNPNGSKELFAFYHPNYPGSVFFAQTIFDHAATSSLVMGYNIFQINLGMLFFENNSLDATEAVLLSVIDKEQNIVMKPEFMEDDGIQALLSEKGLCDGEGFSCVKRIGRDVYRIGRFDMQYGLTMLAFLNTGILTARLSNIWLFVFVFFVLVLGILIFTASSMADRLSEPIVNLSRVMMHFDEKNEMVLTSGKSSSAEVTKLYACFSHMAARIKDLIRESHESGKREKEMEMRMLNAQIDPHFLYNALDTIAWNAIEKGEDEIAEMLTVLSEGFRYSVKQVDELICLRNEMTFIIGYLQLQEMRYKNKFIFSLDIDAELEKLLVPKFVIQPLVENFVIHGLRPGEENILKISARKVENVLEIEVSDNGIGCDVEALNRHLDGDDTVFPQEKIGIKNVNSRIKIKFGNAYGLSYYQNANGGVLAKLKMPIII